MSLALIDLILPKNFMKVHEGSKIGLEPVIPSHPSVAKRIYLSLPVASNNSPCRAQYFQR